MRFGNLQHGLEDVEGPRCRFALALGDQQHFSLRDRHDAARRHHRQRANRRREAIDPVNQLVARRPIAGMDAQ